MDEKRDLHGNEKNADENTAKKAGENIKPASTSGNININDVSQAKGAETSSPDVSMPESKSDDRAVGSIDIPDLKAAFDFSKPKTKPTGTPTKEAKAKLKAQKKAAADEAKAANKAARAEAKSVSKNATSDNKGQEHAVDAPEKNVKTVAPTAKPQETPSAKQAKLEAKTNNVPAVSNPAKPATAKSTVEPTVKPAVKPVFNPPTPSKSGEVSNDSNEDSMAKSSPNGTLPNNSATSDNNVENQNELSVEEKLDQLYGDPYAPDPTYKEKKPKKQKPAKEKKDDDGKGKGKKIAIIVGVILVVIGIVLTLWFAVFRDKWVAKNSEPVYVTSVGTLAGMDMGTNPRYSAVVESQQTIKVEKDESKTVALPLPIEEGDEVTEGQLLFTYDTEEMELALTQANIDLEGITNKIATLKTQITQLEKEREKANKDDKLSYTYKIQEAELAVKTEEYNSSVKSAEVDKINTDILNAEVFAPAAGTIKSINLNSQSDPMTGQNLPFISIIAKGDYRIKGTVSELNIDNLNIGQRVVIHSRVKPEEKWKGSIETIDFENPVSGNDNGMMMYYDSGNDESQQSSKYNFYVSPDSIEGLMLGQHVYIEPDTSLGKERVGIWLPAFYIDHSEKESFVWAQDENEYLEKRKVVLGDYDAELDLYQIVSGVAAKDYIAYPDESLMVGMPTVIDRYSTLPTSPGIDTGFDDGFGMDGALEGGYDDGFGFDDGFGDDYDGASQDGNYDYNDYNDEDQYSGLGYYDEDGNYVPAGGDGEKDVSQPDITFYDED